MNQQQISEKLLTIAHGEGHMTKLFSMPELIDLVQEMINKPVDRLLISIQMSLPMNNDGKIVVDKYVLKEFIEKWIEANDQ